jgi:FG-GAP-like repeat/Abnormal spindle-like microcephaly-assoc'd, ASPM-SPD-2-Hydin/FG-GAP repeat
MNSVFRQLKGSGMAAILLAMLMVMVQLAGTVMPAQAQPADHPPAFFPYPSTFPIKTAICGLGSVAAAAVGDFNGDGKLDTASICGWEIDVALGNGDSTFQYPIVNTFTLPGGNSGHTPYAIAVGDFNGDSRLDLSVWGVYSPGGYNEINIFLGNGNGTVSYGNTYTAPNAYWNPLSNSLYVADFNGDGKLDLVGLAPYCGSNLPCVAVYLGKGDGTFQSAVLYSTIDPNHPGNTNIYGMAVGDLNGDGKPDIAVTQSNGMVVLLNNGNGTFGAAAYYDNALSHQSEIGIAIGDVNKDGKNDIVTTTYQGDLVLFLNQGGGKFALKGSIGKADGGGQGSWLVSMADINGDKKQDLVVTDWAGEVWTFFGKGTGIFTAGAIYPLQRPQDTPPTNVALADFNGDGVLDIFLAGNQGWLGQVALGRSDGTFQTNAAYSWAISGAGKNLVTADFNGDGFPDVAYSYARSNDLTQEGFEVALGSSHGVLGVPAFVKVVGSCGGYTEWIATGDVNGDGKADIVATVDNSSNTGCPNNQVAVVIGKGTGKFGSAVLYSTGSTAQSYDVFLKDVNGDGKPDIVTSNRDGTISILLNNGKGTFGTAKVNAGVAALNPHLNSLTFGDFNGDGKLDIAVAPNSRFGGYNVSNTVYVLPGNGDGTFQAPIVITGVTPDQYTTSERLAAGDFNNDGKMDLFVAMDSRSPCFGTEEAVLLGKGNGTFTPQSPICAESSYYYSATPVYPVIGDFNGDGKLDVFLPFLQQGWGAGPLLLQGKGDGTFTQLACYYIAEQQAWLGSGFYVGQASYGAAVADFNGDGTPDIAVLNNNTFSNVDYISFVTVMFNNTLPVSVSPLNMVFKAQLVGTSKSATVLVTNDQTTTLTINSVTVGGADPGDFAAKSACKSSLKAGFECTITVTFKPTQTGVRTATLNINDSAGTQTVQIKGTGK